MITDISQLDPNGTYTYSDYLKWQFEKWGELLSGRFRIFNKPGKSLAHHTITKAIGHQLFSRLIHPEYEILATPLPVVLGNLLVDTTCDLVIPDLYVINKDISWVNEIGWHGIPDWIIEVSDQQTFAFDTTAKMKIYERYGVREYWIVQSEEKAVNVYVLEADQYALVDVYESGEIPSRIYPNLVISHDRIFR